MSIVMKSRLVRLYVYGNDKTMVKEHIYLRDLHFEHMRWLNLLSFERNEIEIFEHQLSDIVTRNTSKDILAEAEHYQNQFIRHKEVLDELVHEINEHETGLARFAKEHQIATNHMYFDDHGGLRDKIETQVKIFRELKTEYRSYLSKWM